MPRACAQGGHGTSRRYARQGSPQLNVPRPLRPERRKPRCMGEALLSPPPSRFQPLRQSHLLVQRVGAPAARPAAPQHLERALGAHGRQRPTNLRPHAAHSATTASLACSNAATSYPPNRASPPTSDQRICTHDCPHMQVGFPRDPAGCNHRASTPPNRTRASPHALRRERRDGPCGRCRPPTAYARLGAGASPGPPPG